MNKAVFLIFILLIIFPPSITFSEDIPEFNKYYEDSLSNGLRNIDPYIYYMLKRPELCPRECLENLSGYSFDTPALYLRISEENFLQGNKKGVFSGIDSFSRFVRSIQRNTIWKAQIIHIFLISIIFAFLSTSLLFVLVRSPVDLPLYIHEIKEKRFNILKMALLLLPSLYGLPYLAGAILVLYAERSSKRAIAVCYLIILFLLPFLMRYEKALLDLLSDNVVRAVVNVNEGRDNKGAIVFLKDIKDSDWRVRFSYALSLKREGRLEEALSIFKELSESRHDYRILNNIGNCLFLEKKIKDAIDYYTRSSQLKESASTFYNLSQAYKESLEFQKGKEYYQRSIALNPELISWFSKISTKEMNRLLIDEVLDPSVLWDFAIKRSVSLQGRSIKLFEILLPLLMGIILFIKSPVSAYRCSKCGKIICNICQKKRLWGKMCADCHDVLISPDKTDAKTRLERILFLQRKKEKNRRIFTILSIIPGLVEFYLGRIITGSIVSLLFYFSLGLIILSDIYTVETFRQTYLLWMGIVLGSIILILHFLTAWRLRRWV